MATKLRNLRVREDLWVAAREVAAGRGETLTEVLTKALERYVRRHQ